MKKLLLLFLLLPFGITAQSFDQFISSLRSMKEIEREKYVDDFLKLRPASPLTENDTTFVFFWYGKANKVEIAGALQHGWARPDEMEMVSCGGKSFFFRSYHAPADARVDYQLIVDGNYMTDPRNPVITPSGFGPHSQAALPGFKSDTLMLIRQGIPTGRIDSMTFTPTAGTLLPRKIKIYVPAGDNQDMPLLLVYDGIEAMSFMSYPVVLDNMIAAKMIRPVVVAFIPPGDRFGESIGHDTKAFIDALCDEMIPALREKYSISAKPGDHGITGISAGGHLALATVFVRPDVICCGAGQSSAITRGLINAVEDFLERDPKPELKVYFDVGKYDLEGATFEKPFVTVNREFHEKLQKEGIPHIYRELNDGHDWANWRERTDEILKYFFGY